MTKGMPNLRFTFIQGPVWAKTPEQLRQDVVEGKSPITGKPVMQEIVENLTKPLTAEEKKTGEIVRTRGPETFTDTPDNLQKMFLEKRMTDFLPIVLPTEEKVNQMLKATRDSGGQNTTIEVPANAPAPISSTIVVKLAPPGLM